MKRRQFHPILIETLLTGRGFAWAILISRVMALLSRSGVGSPLTSFSWPPLELLEPWARTATRSYTSSADSLDVRVRYRTALAQYHRATDVLQMNVVNRIGLAENLCSGFRIGADVAMQFGKSTFDIGLSRSYFSAAEEVVQAYRTALGTRRQAVVTVRAFMKDIDELPRRNDMPKLQAVTLSKILQALQLAHPEIYSKSFEEIVSLDSQAPSKFLEQIEGLRKLKEINVSQGLEVSKLCSAVFREIKFFSSYDNPIHHRILIEESQIFNQYYKLVDLTADFLAYK